ncbi:MAG TPA: histidinol-phosphate aminotransferase family protein [Acidilobales archaeon]|nr:histidinol-phosphate aminotransferase family protein [Acidilobales archaeon]
MYRKLKEAIATYNDVESDNVLIDAGATNILHAVFVRAKKLGGRIITYRPTFPYPLEYAKNIDIQVRYVDLDHEFKLNIEDILQLNPKESDVIMIINPNNPTGNIVLGSSNYMKELLSSGALVIHDEVYFEFSGFTFKDLIRNYDNLVIVRSLSKAFALAGFRVGYALGSRELISELRNYQQYYPIPTVSAIAGITALSDLDYMKSIVSEVIKEREWLMSMLNEVEGIIPYESLTNFILISLKDIGIKGEEMFNYLKQNGVYVSYYPHEPRLTYCIRVSIGLREENEIFIKLLKSYVGRLRG